MGDDTIKKNISKNIAKYRESAGLSQKELANKLGVVPSRISNWETGANCPTIDILFEVCEVLGVSINDIYGVYPDSKFVLKYGEQDLLKKYRTLDSHGKKIVDFVLTVEPGEKPNGQRHQHHQNGQTQPESRACFLLVHVS